MLSRISSLSPRRLIALGLAFAAVSVGILLIILWQVGLFDSAPPPATIESAVESVRQGQQEQEQGAGEPVQSREQANGEEPSAEQSRQESGDQDLQDSSAASDGQESQQSQDAEPEPAVSYDYGQEQAEQTTDQQAGQDYEAQQSQQQVQQAQQTEQGATIAETPSLADLAGTWNLSGQGTSFVGYRIGEELANIGTATAVGRTSDVVVTLEFDGAVITSVIIEADLRTLTSDQSFRDSALRTRGIETDTYPFATFVLTEPIPIDALPTGEQTLSATVQGTLDLHGVTNQVSIALEGQYVDGLVVVVGSTEIALADYDIEPPTGFRVLSIDDIGIMEFQLVLERAP